MNDNFGPSGTVLVAGGAGFLGSHLCKRLIHEGQRVICLDNLLTGRRENVQALLDNSLFSFVLHDVVEPIPLDISATHIYNLACPASPRHYQADPVHTLLTCVYGSRNLLELARKCGARILQASTSEIYGNPHVHPQPESYRGNVNTVGMRSCYDEGKRCAETLFSDYGARWHLPVKIARIFNTYGPGMAPDDGRLVSNFILQALNGSPLTVYGDGSQTRSLCYVDDLIEGLVRLMNTPPLFHGPVNLGGPQENTVLEIARLICKLVKVEESFQFFPLPSDDPEQRCPDIALARRCLKWQPATGLEAGLRKTIDYFAHDAAYEPQEAQGDVSGTLGHDSGINL
ncbi:UDP-glucuronic acid decarboxylase family protein [Eoetvoesiella caeni]